MKKTSFLLFIFIAWLSAFSLAQAGPGELYLADYLASLRNFATEGQVLHQTGPNRATLTLAENGYSSIQPKSYYPVTDQLLTQRSEEMFTFDFSLSNFQRGDSFSIIYPYYSEENFYSIVCRVQPYRFDQSRDTLLCHSYHHYDGKVVQMDYTMGMIIIEMENFAINDTIYTIVLNRYNINDFGFYFWQQGQTTNGMNEIFHPVSGRLPTAIPKIVLDQDSIASPNASLSLHRFYSSDRLYYHEKPVQLVSQVDPNWRDELLGHTTDQTIGDIGCLLASVTMLFRTHGYYQFPDGSELDPSSLNRWLQAQKDGYANKNLIVWTALTRLSNQLHEYYLSQGIRLPKFEYQAITNNLTLSMARYHVLDSIFQGQPLIVEFPGHFTVANGANYSGDITIKDPLDYDTTVPRLLNKYTRFPESYRRLVPSFTDQSYFLLNIIGDAQVTFLDEQDNSVSPQRVALFEPETTEVIGQQVFLAKPNSGKYYLRLRPLSPDTRFSFFVYNDQGEVATYQDATGEIDLTRTLELDFTYQKDQAEDFFLVDGEPPVPPKDPWQVLFEDVVWSWQFPRLMIKHLYQGKQYDQIALIALNYRQRGYLDQSIYDQLLQLISDS